MNEENDRKRLLLLACLLDDFDEHLIDIFEFLLSMSRKSTQNLIKNRVREGAFSILIERYLFTDHDKFYEYLRVTPRVFYVILKYIYDDIYVEPYNRVKNPIDPSQKLCIALRYIRVFQSEEIFVKINSFLYQ